MEGANTGTDSPGDKLTIPPPSDLIRDVALLIRDVSTDLIGITASPASRLEREDASVSGSVIGDLSNKSSVAVNGLTI